MLAATVIAINRPGQHVCRCPSRWTSLAFPQAAIDGIRRSFTSREAEIRLHVLRRTRESHNEAFFHPLARAERIGAMVPGVGDFPLRSERPREVSLELN